MPLAPHSGFVEKHGNVVYPTYPAQGHPLGSGREPPLFLFPLPRPPVCPSNQQPALLRDRRRRHKEGVTAPARLCGPERGLPLLAELSREVPLPLLSKMAAGEVEAALTLLSRVAALEEPLEELRALRLAVQALPPSALRERGPRYPLAGLFVLMARGDT